MSIDIVTFTMNPAVDVFGVTDEIFDDSKSRCDKASSEPGGGGINVARNIQRMGSQTMAVFPAGGVNGALLKKLLAADKTPFTAIEVADETRQNFAITERKRKVMHHFVFPGPVLSETEFQQCQDSIFSCAPQPRYLVLSGSLPSTVPVTFYREVITKANQKGTQVMLDTSGPALSESLFAGAYLAKLNRKEFASLANTFNNNPSGFDEHADMETLYQQMKGLVAKGAVQVLIVTLSRGGAMLVSANGEAYLYTAPKVHIVSHVGAGDSFMSALVHQLNQDAELKTAAHYGVAAAAVTVQLEGNQLTDLNWLERMCKEVHCESLKD
ncbi:1-phosphofructokinase family hexose kinase [Aliidiomarina celeris]|uniref:1-phosphofructokinase family hexose kinase n=1 Tax=Aliidiomarina celeris TaxID=2249428 RepID=UPI000DE95F87|nr:1-phosphofructokinase family hexose kinase [Aliidiomarina celeris]